MSLIYLFGLAFAAASLLPLGSEWYLLLLLEQGELWWSLLIIASLGNTLGSVLNYALGRYSRNWLLDRLNQWFKLNPSVERQQKTQQWFDRYGVWSLLLSWVPIIGDPITFLAGVIRVKFWQFLVLVATAKTLRYITVIWLWQQASQ